MLRLFRLFADQRGNVLVLAAAAMPMLVGSAAFALDTIQLALFNRQLQRAADSGAIAGARAVAQGADVPRAVRDDLEENQHPQLREPETVAVGARLGFDRTVHLALQSQVKLPFMSIFTNGPVALSAAATAALVDEGTFCVYSLHGGNQTGIDLDGTGTISFSCAIKTNSTSGEAVTVGGNSTISAPIIAAVGGLDGTRNRFGLGTRLQPYSAPEADPLASLPDPPANICQTEPQGRIVSGGDTGAHMEGTSILRTRPGSDITLAPGCYESLELLGTVRLQPGTYYVNGGDVVIGAQAHLIGADVTLVMTGAGGDAGDFRVHGGSKLELSAPQTGPYGGVLLYRDRRAARAEIQVTGNSESSLEGAIYLPSSDITFTGHAGMDVQCLQLIGQIIRFRGTADLSNQCARGNTGGFRQTVVRLVE